MSWLGKILLLLAFIGYTLLLHFFIIKEDAEMWELLLVFTPLLSVAIWAAFSMVNRMWWPLLALLLAMATYFIVAGNYERIGLRAVNGLSDATINLFMLWLFGRTLLPGKEPLISQIARHINGELEQDLVEYTRHVTIAWCIFFSLEVLISLLLYVFASLAAWSFFINVLNLPLLIIMFLSEKAYRTARFPDHPRTSILKVIEVYSKDFAAPRKTDH